MKRLKYKWPVLVLIILFLAAGYFANPFLRVKTFLYFHHGKLEDSLLTYNSVPSIPGIDYHNTWEGEHTMTEYILFQTGFGSGSKYYGCYYSWDDVPLAFQNTPAKLIQNGHQYWEWKGEGDNRGATQRILPNWFYFEASF